MPSTLSLDLVNEMTQLRRDLHRRPEIMFEEHETSATIQRYLDSIGVQYKAGLAGGTGVLGFLPATKPGGSCYALRTDIDALPITEETGVPYTSEIPGRMHACGHDGHIAIMLGTITALVGETDRLNDLLFFFQPAEEGGAGGKRMVADGVLNGSILGRPVDRVFGLHGMPHVDLGVVTSRPGPIMASAAQFEIEIEGVGAHAAYPHRGIDPILIAAHIITSLQSIASRRADPLDSVVVTVGKVIAGRAHNIIPETAYLGGTIRTLREATEQLARVEVERIAHNTALALGGTAKVSWQENPYPATVNHPDVYKTFVAVGESTLGSSQVRYEEGPSMAGEDFAFYAREVPSCFFFLGLKPEKQSTYPGLHSPHFDFNDDAIATGIKMMVALAMN